MGWDGNIIFEKKQVTNCRDCIFNVTAKDGIPYCILDKLQRDLIIDRYDVVTDEIPEWCQLKSGDLLVQLKVEIKIENKSSPFQEIFILHEFSVGTEFMGIRGNKIKRYENGFIEISYPDKLGRIHTFPMLNIYLGERVWKKALEHHIPNKTINNG